MRRALALAAILTVTGGGCVASHDCRDGTVLLSLTFSGAAASADTWTWLALDGGTERAVEPLAHQPGDGTGTLELLVPRYGSRQRLRVRAVARAGGVPVGQAEPTA